MAKDKFMEATKGLGHHDLRANFPEEDLQKDFKKIVKKQKVDKSFDFNFGDF